MFVGWIRDNFLSDLNSLKDVYTFLDTHQIMTTHNSNPELCFGAYEGEKLVGLITAYKMEKIILINSFHILEEYVEVGARLLKILLNNIDLRSYSVQFLSNQNYLKLFKSFGFLKDSDFVKYIYSGEAVAFNFTNKLSKEITQNDFTTRSKEISLTVLNDDYKDYFSELYSNTSSLKLATGYGFLHSYAVNKKYIKISPWYMSLEAFMDAEKLLRGVLYHRGLKVIYAFVPSAIEEITKLYEDYKFKKDEDHELLYFGEKPNIRLESVYAL